MTRILVVGATGFIGRRLAAKGAAAGHEVFAAARRDDHGLECRTLLVSDPLAVEAYAEFVREHRIKVVFNLLAAGVDPSDRDTNRLLAANAFFPPRLALEAAKAGARAFVQVGSSAEYAPLAEPRPLREDDPLDAVRLYGATKAAGSLVVLAAARSVGLPTAAMRAFNVFGPGEKPHRLFPSLVTRLGRGEPVPLSAGRQVRDFIPVDQACEALLRAARGLMDGTVETGAFNLGSGRGLAVRDFVALVARSLGAPSDLLHFDALPIRPDDLPFVVASTARLDDAIGTPSQPGLEEAIALAIREIKGGTEN